MTKEIPLTQGKVALVDDEDYKWLIEFKWCAAKSRTTFYAMRHTHQQRPETIQMQRDIIRPLAKFQIDHINHNGLDNRRENLRIATPTQNNQNRQKSKGKSSQYRGVSWSTSTRKWRVEIKASGSKRILGHFDNEIDAALAYDRAAREFFKEFASLNFPDLAPDAIQQGRLPIFELA